MAGWTVPGIAAPWSCGSTSTAPRSCATSTPPWSASSSYADDRRGGYASTRARAARGEPPKLVEVSRHCDLRFLLILILEREPAAIIDVAEDAHDPRQVGRLAGDLRLDLRGHRVRRDHAELCVRIFAAEVPAVPRDAKPFRIDLANDRDQLRRGRDDTAMIFQGKDHSFA